MQRLVFMSDWNMYDKFARGAKTKLKKNKNA